MTQTNKNERPWQMAIPTGLIHPNQVHVWRVSLDIPKNQRETLLGMLSTDEVARARRFHFERDQERFIVARGMLRQILGHYLGKNPPKLQFEYTSYGKPILANNPGYDALRFNLSHSNSFALYAVTRGRDVGIDIECINEGVAVEQIAQAFFSQDEISSLESIPESKRNELFFQYWTRKEAFIKATGKGLSFPMDQFDVSTISGIGLSPITLPGDKRESSRWYVQDLFPGRGYAAAAVVEGGDCDLSCWHYKYKP